MKLSTMVEQSIITNVDDKEEIQIITPEEQVSTEEQELAQEIENLKAMAGI